jgi:hypothetical protein
LKKLIAFVLAAAMMLSLAACGGKADTKSVDLNALYESYAQYMPEMFSLDEDTMMNFLGIDAADCANYAVYICGDGLRADEVWLIEAKDEAALGRLKEMAEARMQAKVNETISYVPDQYVIVEQGVILTNGLYLALLVSPDVEALQAGFEAAMAE